MVDEEETKTYQFKIHSLIVIHGMKIPHDELTLMHYLYKNDIYHVIEPQLLVHQLKHYFLVQQELWVYLVKTVLRHIAALYSWLVWKVDLI